MFFSTAFCYSWFFLVQTSLASAPKIIFMVKLNLLFNLLLIIACRIAFRSYKMFNTSLSGIISELKS